MQSLRSCALAIAMLASLAMPAQSAELVPLTGTISPNSLPPYPSEAAEQAGLAELSPALRRCIAVYRLHFALQQQGQGATNDAATYSPEHGALFLQLATQQEQIASVTEALAKVAGEIEPILAAYTDRVVENIKAGEPAVDALIAGDLEQCRTVALALRSAEP